MGLPAKILQALHIYDGIIAASLVQFQDLNPGEPGIKRSRIMPGAGDLTASAPPAILWSDFDGNPIIHNFPPRTINPQKKSPN
jgi:hypothetical protein